MKTKIIKPLVIFTIIILLCSISFILYTRVFNVSDTSNEDNKKTDKIESVIPEETNQTEEKENQPKEEQKEESKVEEPKQETKVENKVEETKKSSNNSQSNSNQQQTTQKEVREEPKQETINNNQSNQNTNNNQNNNNQNSSVPEKTDLEEAIEQQQEAGWPVTYYNGHTININECYSIGGDLQARQETTHVTQFECRFTQYGSSQVAGLTVYYIVDGVEQKDSYNSYINKIN